MAEKLKSLSDWEREDAARMELALREINSSPNLRFFILSLLTLTNATGTPEGGNALDTARAIGVHSVGTTLITILNMEDPTTYARLLLEDANEQQARLKANGDYNE